MRSRVPLFAFTQHQIRFGAGLLFAIGSFALPLAAHAAIPFFGPIIPDAINKCAAGWGAVIDVINRIISFLITIAIVFVAPLMIAWAGFLFVVNPVNASGKEQAKKILTNTIVGIVVALAGWLIVDAVMAVLYNPGADVPGGKIGVWSNLITSGGLPYCLVKEESLKNLNQTTNVQGINGSGLITTSSGTLIGASGENVSNAISYLNGNAQSASTGQCALYVRQALAAGGLTSFNTNHPTDAYQYGSYLTNAGLSTVSPNNYSPQIGDVMVFQPVAGHPSGHIQMYNGNQWVSDFKQSNTLPSTDYQGGSYAIYRS